LEGAAEILQMTANELAKWCIRQHLVKYQQDLMGEPVPHSHIT